MRRPQTYEFKGEQLTAEEIAARLGTSVRAVYLRLWRHKNLDTEARVKNHKTEKKNFIEFRGERLWLRDFCKKYHVSENTYFRAKKNNTFDFFLAQLEKRCKLIEEGKDDEARRVCFVPGFKFGSGEHHGRPRSYSVPKPRRPMGRPRKEVKPVEPKKYKENQVTGTVERDPRQTMPLYNPDYEPVRKVLEAYGIGKKTADYVITKKRKFYHIKKIQIRNAAFNFILRTEIPAFVLDCQHDHKAADAKLAEINAATKKLTLEEMKAAHPLVTDERFFKTSFFPNIDSYEVLTECNYKRPAEV